MHRTTKAVLLSAAALGVSGCVAAAIPLAAGGVLARSATDGVEAQSQGTESARAPTQGPTPLVQGATKTQAVAQPQDEALTGFLIYSLSAADDWKAALEDTDKATQSALLDEPSALNGDRKDCPKAAPTVLIDLDPAGQTYAPGSALLATPQLSESLDQLRAKGIRVAWISGAAAAYAGDVRAALKNSALDPASTDTLVLMRYPGDRKQTRRESLASASCLVAIAGDERADFDELYDHIKAPEAALALEKIIGDGWFLIPSLVEPSHSPSILASNKEPDS